ncbi:MAG: hypothetical protein HYZ75_13145 [Elusimicrobia bacterium]|nr:hypothetical protein [Elusimicrobiota bacterium]
MRLRFERGAETRRFNTNVELGRGYNTVVVSSGASPETLIVNILPLATKDGRRFELIYQVEWDAAGRNIQAQDSAEVSGREEALLSEVVGEWKLWGRIAAVGAGDSCTPPPSGGGLRARLRVRRGELERALTRRTISGVRSNLLSDGLSLSLDPRVARDTDTVEVRWALELGTTAASAWDPAWKEAQVRLGVEQLLEGDGQPEGVWFSLDPVQVLAHRPITVKEEPDPESNWLRHAGQTISFLHPPRWQVRQSCGPDLLPDSWKVVDLDLPRAKRLGQELVAFIVPGPRAPLEERVAAMRAGGVASQPESVAVGGGSCLLWRTIGIDGDAHASCDARNGLRLELSLALESGQAERFEVFKKLVASLAFEGALPAGGARE